MDADAENSAKPLANTAGGLLDAFLDSDQRGVSIEEMNDAIAEGASCGFK